MKRKLVVVSILLFTLILGASCETTSGFLKSLFGPRPVFLATTAESAKDDPIVTAETKTEEKVEEKKEETPVIEVKEEIKEEFKAPEEPVVQPVEKEPEPAVVEPTPVVAPVVESIAEPVVETKPVVVEPAPVVTPVAESTVEDVPATINVGPLTLTMDRTTIVTMASIGVVVVGLIISLCCFRKKD